MTDRELLELAAKAVGVNLVHDEENAKTYVVSDGGLYVAIERHTAYPLAATIRAIVRAAAEIGRNMK